MKHTSFTTALLESLDEADRVIALAEAEEYLIFEHGELAVLAGVQKANALRMENQLEQLRVDLEKFAKGQKMVAELQATRELILDAHDELTQKMIAYGAKLIEEKSQRKKTLSEAGKKGAKVKNKDIDNLKAWALEEAKKRRGDDKAIAKALYKVIPDELKEASNDAERLIYEALLAKKKEDKIKRQASHT